MPVQEPVPTAVGKAEVSGATLNLTPIFEMALEGHRHLAAPSDPEPWLQSHCQLRAVGPVQSQGG
jgi:hypothetical protein